MEKELLNSFYGELLSLIGEEAMLNFFTNYRGLTINVPKKLYDGTKVVNKLLLLGKVDLQTKQSFARKYDYSQRQIERLMVKYKKSF